MLMNFKFDPTNIANAAKIFSLGGSINSAIGGFYSAQTQIQNLNFQANIAGINATMAETSAQQALYAGNQDYANITQRAGQLVSTQRTALAGNGVDVSQGSAAEMQASTKIMGEADANTAMANAVRSAWGYRMQATNFQNEALIDKATANTINPTQSLLGGLGKVASEWYSFSK